MSAIDQYKHVILGVLRCPSSYELVYKSGWDGVEEQSIAIYRLLEDVHTSEADFDGKEGDIIVGGGSGEAQAMRIDPYEAFRFMTGSPQVGEDFGDMNSLFKAFWNMNTAFYLCEGFRKVGWDGKEQIEYWLTEHVLAFLQKNYPENYKDVIGHVPLNQNGDICRQVSRTDKQNSEGAL